MSKDARGQVYRMEAHSTPPRILSPGQAAKYLGLPEHGFRALAARGLVKKLRYPAATTDGLRMASYYDVRDLDAFIEACKLASPGR
jgi:hypothetical protein